MTLTLTPAEIFEITRKVQPAAQMRVLRQMGIRCHRTDDPDQPVTTTEGYIQHHGVPVSELMLELPRRPQGVLDKS